MAKRKRAPHEKPFSRPFQKSESETAVAEPPVPSNSVHDEVAQQFIGKWNRLISTTNWEKGKIISEWREALVDADAAVTEYSDEAWAQLVGGVTSQHVGRLRRVYERFGDVTEQYEGLYWSHFQAAIDWEDAEMWLEGSIQNGWSVSQMRGKRWETVGLSPEQQQAEVEQLAAEQAQEATAEETQAQDTTEPASPVSAGGDPTLDLDSRPEPTSNDPAEPVASSDTEINAVEPTEKRVRLNVDVESLPDDIAEAFESFKLAIIAHRRENWRDSSVESVVECLESLKQLALAE